MDIHGGGAYPYTFFVGGYEHGRGAGKTWKGLQLHSTSWDRPEVTTVDSLYCLHLPPPFLHATFSTEAPLLCKLLLT